MTTFLALLTIAIASVSSNYASPVDSHEVDRAALLSFKSGVWGNLSNWSSLRPVCNWTGVECDSGGRVIHLLLSHSNLTGIISPAIGNLSALERLELDSNQLSGSLPPELGMLSSLVKLNLHNNFLEGPIPKTLGLPRNLSYLLLQSNKLSGDIPEAVVCNCSSLTYIGLSNNSLSGEIPFTAHCHLPGLNKLTLYENKLVGAIPPSISNFTSLEWVLLHNNFLTGNVLPSHMFSKMPNLTYLYLSYNNFSSDGGNTDFEPFLASLVNCTCLQELGVSSTGIEGKIPSFIGNLSANLSILLLHDNSITGAIPGAIGNLPKLTVLSLLNNMLEGPIPSEILQPRLFGLYLSNNRISGEIPRSIGIARHLSVVDISYNQLQGAIPETLSNLTELESLYLHHNQLAGAIPSGLSCSMRLDLSYNKLTGRIPAQITGLSKLQIYVNLSNNLLEGPLPLQIGRMESMQALDLSANRLSGTIPVEIRCCAGLVYVNLSRNMLQGSLPSSMDTLRYLQVLDLCFNGLTGVLPQSLQTARGLRFANFSYNNFSGEVPKEGMFAQLTYDSFLGNPDLCGPISGMAPCKAAGNRRHVRLLYIVIVVAVVVTVLAGSLAMVCVVDHDLMKTRLGLTVPSVGQLSRFPTGSVNATGEMESEHPRISYRELVDATHDFSEVNLIGKGGYGHVYKGVLREGSVVVAVKVLHQDRAGEVVAGSFERECRVLRSIRHRNLIRVITACSTPEFKAIVLPFMPNGNLESLVHGPPGGGGNKTAAGRRLDLDLLLSIASDVAEGVAYLHHHAPVKVVHCDLKPSNVLLDGDMTAIVSDFGVSKLVQDARDLEMGGASMASTCSNSITRLLQGSVGYIAPGKQHTRSSLCSDLPGNKL